MVIGPQWNGVDVVPVIIIWDMIIVRFVLFGFVTNFIRSAALSDFIKDIVGIVLEIFSGAAHDALLLG